SAEGEPRAALVPLPKVLPRLVRMPSHAGMEFVFIEDAVRRFLPRLFQGFVVQKSLLFRAIRNADLNVEEEKDEDFAELMTEVLRQRRRSSVVRLEVEEDAPPALLAFLRKSLDAAGEDIYATPSPLNLKSLFELAGMAGLDALRDPPWTPQPPPELPPGESLWQILRGRDILLHHPYDSFDSVVRFVSEAASDPSVLAIKQTLYRCGGGSKIVRALERAAENGKHVCVLVELKARFDETRNIEWARRLERAGAHVIYGLAGLKTHAKACLIVRREPDGIRRYVHLSTGNYNESTARLYTDLGFMTGDDAFGADISAFFNTITGCSIPSQWQKIEMAPLGLKARILRMIQREASRSSASQPGLIMAKMNSLVDPDVIKALYAAAKAGVKIRLNIRGVCCLNPGGRRLDIEVTSIVGRFLEHSRIFYFRNGGDEEVYLSSADWMPRNLDRRVELMFPIEAPPLKARVLRILEMCFQDNVKARRLLPSGRYERVRPPEGAAPFSVQQALMDEALERSLSAERAARGEFKPRTPQK
ncbi:MAG TPA: polyphosphate kinase 1, partial [Candidatus Brocadiia bacterium]|nr:polyphosphate kinase 1 [Candidatus Brocadiia bacterium]